MSSLLSIACKAGYFNPLLRTLRVAVGSRSVQGSPQRILKVHPTRRVFTMAAAATGQSAQQTLNAGAPYIGHCACGAVQFELQTEPGHQLYCHCNDCQLHHAAPIRQSIIFTDQVSCKPLQTTLCTLLICAACCQCAVAVVWC